MLDTPLSKSALQAGAQCPRMLWLRYNRPYPDDNYGRPDEEIDTKMFEIGNIVGEAAQSYFGEEGLVVIDTDRGFNPENYSEYARQTEAYMNDPDVTCIAEATFYTGDLVVFVDLLHRNPEGGWDIIEVKATNRIGPVHVRDASWQTYVARELCGADIRNTYLMHPFAGWEAIAHKDYVDPDDFELVSDFTDFIADYSSGNCPSPEKSWLEGYTIPQAIDFLSDMVTWEWPPACEVSEPGKGIICSSPYKCMWKEACSAMIQDEEEAAAAAEEEM